MEIHPLPPEYPALPPEFPPAVEPATALENEFNPTRRVSPDGGKKHRLLRRLIAAAAGMLAVSAMLGLLPFDVDSKSPVPSSPDTTVADDGKRGDEALREIPADGTSVLTVLTVLDDGRSFAAGEPGEAGQEEARAWAESIGADWSTLRYVGTDVTKETVTSPDAVLVGDPDDPDSLYVAQGSVTVVVTRTDYYEIALHRAETPSEETTVPEETLPEALQAISENERVATCILLTVYEEESFSFDSADLPAYGEEGQKLALQWAVSQGADLSRLVFDRSETREDPLPEDVSRSVEVRADYYTLDIPLPDKDAGETLPPDDGDDAFPPLPNLDPQRDNIQGLGSEFYIRFMDGDYENWKYLTAGSYWTEDEGHPISTVPGAVYDEETNTLTLENFSGPALDVNLMGNGFTIRFLGENRLEGLQVWGFMYGGSVTFTGDGSLIVNGDETNPVGLVLNAEMSMSCLMVDREVTLEIHGTDAAVGIFDTMMSKSVYYLRPQRLNASRGYSRFDGMEEQGLYNGALFNEGSVESAKVVRFAPADRF